MPYELHLNIQQKAALKAAIMFWEEKSVKNRVTEFLKSCDKFRSNNEAEAEWHKLTKAISSQSIKNRPSPYSQVEAVFITKELGKKIYNWYQYIKYENESQLEQKDEVTHYIDKIYWTPYGSVDAVATFKESWLGNPKLNVAKVYNIACSYALDEHIDDLWYKIPKEIQDSSYNDVYKIFDRLRLETQNDNTCKDRSWSLLPLQLQTNLIRAYWKCRRDNDLPSFMRYFEAVLNYAKRKNWKEYDSLYDLSLSVEEIMLRLSAHQGDYCAVKYFWNKLTEEMKNKSILLCAQIAALNFHDYRKESNNWIRGYKRENNAEICLFLMNQMTVAQKKSFLNEGSELLVARTSYSDIVFDIKDEILTMLLSVWPWQELFITVLKDILQHLDSNSVIMGTFLDVITNEMIKDDNLGFSLKNNKYRSLLQEAWLLIPGFIKKKMRQAERPNSIFFIRNLMNLGDIGSLKLILNDPGIAAVRNRFIEFGNPSYQQLILDNKFEILDQLIDAIFKSEVEKKRFKQSLMPDWYDLKDKLDLAEKLLDWQCDTAEERQSIKKNLFPDQMTDWFITTEEYDIADKYINWKFGSKEGRKKFKDDFKNREFTLSHLYDIWMRNQANIDQAKEKSTKFLNWFLESKEEIARFKKEQLFNIEVTEPYTSRRDELYRMWNTNGFLS